MSAASDPIKLHPLHKQQSAAVEPERNIWLSASAGTGKTQVLTARVFRLLLQKNVRPESLLCLTFTKAGAAEMADRIHKQLARWVRMKDTELAADLTAIGARADDTTRERARTLFAEVLDAPGGGLPIMTIHSFCQTLLASFPSEAGMIPGFKPLEERDQKILAREALAETLVVAEKAGDFSFTQNIQLLSRRYGEDGAVEFLMRCARVPDAMTTLPDSIEPFVNLIVGLEQDGDSQQILTSACSDTDFDVASLRALAAMLDQWGTKRALERAVVISNWLASDAGKRAATIDQLHLIWATTAGSPRSFAKGQAPQDEDYADLATRLFEQVSHLIEQRNLAALAALYARALDAGKRFAHSYAEAKRVAGAVDFDDLIRTASALLDEQHMAEWIRYKMDRHIDHILVDESQDTNQRQWDIVRALTSDFFAGFGAAGEKVRTLFAVGDYKQAIFGFQGTSPENYRKAGNYFDEQAVNVEAPFDRLTLDINFRSTPPVLQLVDACVENLGAEAFGQDEPINKHDPFHIAPGSVRLLKPVLPQDSSSDEADEEQWLTESKRTFARNLARQIRQWIDDPLWLESKGRPANAGDILILVRKRDELASLIVARLFAEGVPVAGVDRLQLDQPLAVQDLMAAIRFVLQPEDELNLAGLLVSPLIGWSQDDLLQHGYRAKGRKLWSHLRGQTLLTDELKPLFDLLNLADFTSPYQFLEQILSGPINGRRKLASRLSLAAIDPIEELLNAALLFERDHVPTLQGFVNWFDRGDVEIKREAMDGGGQVRVMTVHGAKGLQAPIVILADATADPSRTPDRGIDWPLTDNVKLPVVRLSKAERIGRLDEAILDNRKREMEEHWRLFYVAMTRAEEHLIVAGALGPAARGQVPESSWYQAVDQAMDGLNTDWLESPKWGAERIFIGLDDYPAHKTEKKAAAITPARVMLPDWATKLAPPEASPPRPLAPSLISKDDIADPPPTQNMRAAAKRGQILHSLFERLPEVEIDKRAAAADAWLIGQHQMNNAKERGEIVAAALSIINDPRWQGIFGPGSMAEVPLAALVGDHVITGVVDRLVVDEHLIRIIDFKTGRHIPSTIERVPVGYLRQMSAYVVALSDIFPGRKIEAALLYSQGPKLFTLDSAILERHKPGFQPPQ